MDRSVESLIHKKMNRKTLRYYCAEAGKIGSFGWKLMSARTRPKKRRSFEDMTLVALPLDVVRCHFRRAVHILRNDWRRLCVQSHFELSTVAYTPRRQRVRKQKQSTPPKQAKIIVIMTFCLGPLDILFEYTKQIFVPCVAPVGRRREAHAVRGFQIFETESSFWQYFLPIAESLCTP